jgi:hypothetical protein
MPSITFCAWGAREMMELPKYELVRYAKKVKAALPHEDVLTSGRKADIAYSIDAAIRNNPEAAAAG